jgi:hypothetical protein
MPLTQAMTLHEKFTITAKAREFKDAGNMEEYERILRSKPKSWIE